MAEDEEIKFEIDWDVVRAAFLAGDPTWSAIILEAAQELFETTGKVLAGVKMTIHFTLEDDALVPFALDGDWEPLASYIEKGGDINDDMRKFIVGVLRGKRKVPRKGGRPPRAATLLHHAKIAWQVRKWRADGLGDEASIEKAMEFFDVDRRTVQRALKDVAF
jgi:hypothetical protein